MEKVRLVPEAALPYSERMMLKQKLYHYYNSVTDYTVFAEVSSKVLCWSHLERAIRQILRYRKDKQTVRILEVGAGRSGFGNWLKAIGLREVVHWSAQDVTRQNAEWLDSEADRVWYDDIGTIKEREEFDIVFSTYVFEHVSDPSIHLDIIYGLLVPGGSLFIFCPRYDFPGYLCPSSKHLNLFNRAQLFLQWGSNRCLSLLRGRPSFLLQTDVAAFHVPFFIDSDAVHWVSLLDLKLWAKKKGAKLKNLHLGAPPVGSADWIVKRFLTCAVRITK